ncbi:protein of unknown function [Pseudorhizobium banfieldiae]|uniref:Transposase n=1 Tax=Pseudorhizobium banfieldiae TaxID=1125847 RepID=L0NCF2_9HYPH|nr:protein of unknown function [Pseudorhizobium banfieldiae]
MRRLADQLRQARLYALGHGIKRKLRLLRITLSHAPTFQRQVLLVEQRRSRFARALGHSVIAAGNA